VEEKPRRIDQVLSSLGYCSRSEARSWVRRGRVIANGRPVEAADEKHLVSSLRIDGEPADAPDGLLVLLHKPAGYVCSHDKSEGPTVYELLPTRWTRRNPSITSVGRLDRDTTGVLLLTDLGELVQRWTSPRHKFSKIYEVTVVAPLCEELVAIFAAGELKLEGESKPCLPAHLAIIDSHHAKLELIEGRYHQVKRMFASQGCQVTQLHRSQFAEFELGELKPGQWRSLPLPNLRS